MGNLETISERPNCWLVAERFADEGWYYHAGFTDTDIANEAPVEAQVEEPGENNFELSSTEETDFEVVPDGESIAVKTGPQPKRQLEGSTWD